VSLCVSTFSIDISPVRECPFRWVWGLIRRRSDRRSSHLSRPLARPAVY
jgi:hypothetical protein